MHVDLYSDDIICTTSVYMSIYTCATRYECICEIHICRQAVGLLWIDYYYCYSCYSCIAVKLCFGLLIGTVVIIMTFYIWQVLVLLMFNPYSYPLYPYSRRPHILLPLYILRCVYVTAAACALISQLVN